MIWENQCTDKNTTSYATKVIVILYLANFWSHNLSTSPKSVSMTEILLCAPGAK